MKRIGLSFFAVVQLLCWTLAPFAAGEEMTSMGVITGGKKGTYFQFGRNLKDLAVFSNINMAVYNSAGSVENIYAVYKRPRTQLGIVQSDVLAFVAKVQTDATLKRIAKKIKMVFPLYNEEIHILGSQEINEFDDLAGKTVAIGKEGSGTYLTARLLFEISDIVPHKMKTIGTERALGELKAGKIDAMFYVAGYPVKLFNENVASTDRLHLVSIQNKSITEFYPKAEIPAATYSWQPVAVNTAAVKAVLVSFDFRRFHCTTVGQVGRMVYENLDWLIENGHPKWRSVDLDYPLKGWEQYDCVKNSLSGRTTAADKKRESLNPVLKAIKQTLQD